MFIKESLWWLGSFLSKSGVLLVLGEFTWCFGCFFGICRVFLGLFSFPGTLTVSLVFGEFPL